MAARFGVLLSSANARQRGDTSRVGLVLLERTLLDPPRAKAVTRWGAAVRASFADAELLPYAWHLVTHGADDGLRQHASRSLPGPAQNFGLLQDTPETNEAWRVAALTMQALGSTRMVLRTPPSLTPGPLGRRRLETFVRKHSSDAVRFVWEPEGLWEAPETIAFAHTLGIDPILPAFVAGRPVRSEDNPSILVADSPWLRVEVSGRRTRISPDQIDALLEHLDVVPDATLVFSGPRALGNLNEVADALG